MRYTDKTNDLGLLIKLSIMVLVTMFLLIAQAVNAQQFFTDDAAVTTERSFQVETWYGEFESVFTPALGVNSWLELGVGFEFDTKNNFELGAMGFHAKGVTADFEEEGQAFGLVTGVVFDESFASDEFFFYVPYSRMILNESSALHLNLGTAFHDGSVEILYGVRGDFGVHDRVAVVAEVFAENDDFLYHGGLRFSLIPDLLEMDVMYGRGFRSGQEFPGISVGVSFTPDTLW